MDCKALIPAFLFAYWNDMHLTHNQKAGLRMIASRIRPRQGTIDALAARGLIRTETWMPKLTATGYYVERHGKFPEQADDRAAA